VDEEYIKKVVANSTNTEPTTVRKKSFEELFAGYTTNDVLKNSGLSASDAEKVMSAVAPAGGKVFETANGEKYRAGDTVILNGIPHLALEDGSFEGMGIEVVGTTSTTAQETKVDNRLRLSALSGREEQIYGPDNVTENILSPLHKTGGLLFPYTPALQIAGEARWTEHDLVHTNFDVLSYQRTPSATIGISGKFTVQNQREGQYAIAAIHFLRTITKMYYGDQESANANAAQNSGKDAKAGLPPPVLRLRGYGDYMFPDLRCVVKGYSFNFDENMDLIDVPLPAGGNVMLPPLFTLSITIGLQQSPRRVRKDFNLTDFRSGKTMLKGGNWF
jgi:hypothetical protein